MLCDFAKLVRLFNL